MAITINQAPTTPNAVYTNLIHAVSSDQVNNPQFQYVMDIVSGSSVLSRIRQYPNPSGVAIFDPSRILRDYIEYDTSFSELGIYDLEAQTLSVQDFDINFGEEYGTSPSSSVVLYNGAGIAGDPSVTDGTLTVLPATVDPNNGISYNWPYIGSEKLLTDRPDGVPMDGSQDVFYVSAFNGSPLAGSVTIRSLNQSGAVTDTRSISLGPEEFKAANVGYNGTLLQDIPYGLRVTYNGETRIWPYDEDACNYDRVNFAFINNYGMWDFYGFNLPIKKNTSIMRKSFVKPFVDYSSTTSPYNGKRRGTSVYNTSYMDNISVSTPYVTEEVANWLTQLIESPEVYIQEGTNMIPIVITNSNYTHNTNIRSQKAFQYEISYQYANQRQTR